MFFELSKGLLPLSTIAAAIKSDELFRKRLENKLDMLVLSPDEITLAQKKEK
jgi:hypothetical protein